MEAKITQDFAFVSGATGGLGRAFSFACAREGNLFLTGRSEQKLAALRGQIAAQYPHIRIETFACDLTDASAREKMFSHIRSLGIRFYRYCSVAGADIQKAFLRFTQEKLVFCSRVNFESAVSLARFLLDVRAPEFEMVVISSISGVYPMPYFALYSATKCALTSFFSALHVEWKGVASVTTVLPGSIPTREDVKAYIAAQGLWGKLAAMPPEKVAKKSLEALKRNKRTYIPGFWNKLMRAGTALLPLPWKMRFIAARWSKTEKDAF